MYKECLEEVMELPFGLALEEAKSKLVNTYGYVNGERVYFTEFGTTWMIVIKDATSVTFTKDQVKSIGFWNPESGVYRTDLGSVYVIHKLPLRHWSKSYTNRAYKLTSYNQLPGDSFINMLDHTRTEFWVDKDGTLRYYDFKIGAVKGKQIECIQLFEQEVNDWMKNEHIL